MTLNSHSSWNDVVLLFHLCYIVSRICCIDFYGHFLHKKLSYEAYDLPCNKFSKLFDIAFAEMKIEAET